MHAHKSHHRGQHVTIVGSEFYRNRSFCARLPGSPVCPPTNGGGVSYAAGAAPATNLQPLPSLTINDTTFSGNIAGAAGGGVVVAGRARISSSTFADNAARAGGALSIGFAAISAPQVRALLIAGESEVEITGSTFTDNLATVSGGGIIAGDGSDLTFNNTVVSGNVAPQGREVVAQPDPSTPITKIRSDLPAAALRGGL